MVEVEWLSLASRLVNVNTRVEFSASFGVSPIIAHYLYSQLPTHSLAMKDFLLTLNFMKVYDVSDWAHGRWGMCDRTYRTHLWQSVPVISAALHEV